MVCVNTQPSLHSRVRARCPSILPVRPSVSAATTGTWTPSISTYIFGMFCLETTGRTSCLARPISCSSRWAICAPMASAARSMALAVTSRPGEQLHRLAPRSERHLTAHHGFHASHARRGFQTGDTQFGVHRVLAFRAMGAQRNRGASVRPAPARSARSWSAIPCSGPSGRTGQGIVRWSASGGSYRSSWVSAEAPAWCMADRKAVSTASRSSRPFLRRSWKTMRRNRSTSRATSCWMACAVFFPGPTARSAPRAASGRSFD